jgi:dsRNA-specific ribonuclease
MARADTTSSYAATTAWACARSSFKSGFEHSLTSHAGAAWARSPWEAVQRAASDALHKLEADEPALRDWTATDESPR